MSSCRLRPHTHNGVLCRSQIQNLGFFAVQDLTFRAEIWAVTLQGNQLVNITDFGIQPVRRGFSPPTAPQRE